MPTRGVLDMEKLQFSGKLAVFDGVLARHLPQEVTQVVELGLSNLIVDANIVV